MKKKTLVITLFALIAVSIIIESYVIIKAKLESLTPSSPSGNTLSRDMLPEVTSAFSGEEFSNPQEISGESGMAENVPPIEQTKEKTASTSKWETRESTLSSYQFQIQAPADALESNAIFLTRNRQLQKFSRHQHLSWQ